MIGLSTIKDQKKEVCIEKLNRIEGRVRGLMKMIEEDRDCVDILTQLSATHEALRVVSKSVIQTYLETQVSSTLITTNKEKRDIAYESVLDTLYKYIK